MRNPESYYYKQGYDAAKAYERLSSCPYTKTFAQYAWWVEGWRAYKDESDAIALLTKGWAYE